MSVVITPQTPLNMFIVVQTMTSQRKIEAGSDGERALRRYVDLDSEPLTVNCALYNRVWSPAAQTHLDVLVHAHQDILPRWVTRAARTVPPDQVQP
jgi:hypothetical protein